MNTESSIDTIHRSMSMYDGFATNVWFAWPAPSHSVYVEEKRMSLVSTRPETHAATRAGDATVAR
jgi:hypothetical protein